MLTNSPNAVLSKTLLSRYQDLPLPADRILATYVWIDGTGEHIRCKDRTLNFIPKVPKGQYLDAMLIAERLFLDITILFLLGTNRGLYLSIRNLVMISLTVVAVIIPNG